MKKNSVFIGILACLVFGAFAMEEGELSRNEAKSIFDDSGYNLRMGAISYQEYRSDMMRAIPVLGYTQDGTHNPLLNAVWHHDYDFAEFLLDHGANPNFSNMIPTSALAWLQSQPQTDPEIRSLYELLRTYRPRQGN